jgi:hypothetical protein
MASKLDTIDEAINDDEKRVEVLPRKPKRAEKKAVRGESSMTPPHRERHGPPMILSKPLNAHAFIQTGSRLQREKALDPNATCSATSPRAAEKPRPIPVIWDNPDARHKGFAYDDPRQVHFSQDFYPQRGFESYFGDQLYGNATAPYGNHPSGSFMSDLGVTLASRFPAGHLQAGKFSFLTFIKRVYKKTRTLNELLKKTCTLIQLPKMTDINPHPHSAALGKPEPSMSCLVPGDPFSVAPVVFSMVVPVIISMVAPVIISMVAPVVFSMACTF